MTARAAAAAAPVGRRASVGPVPPVVPADRRHIGTVADLVAEAFAELPAVAWLVPDGDRRAIPRGHFALLVEHAMTWGEVHLTTDGAGAAVWFFRDGDPPPPPADYDARLAAATGAYLDRFRVLDELFDAHHPGEPHHHLGLLAVRPGRQGAGYGTALLRHHHRRLDAEGIAGYLEASSAASRALYARHGYLDRGRFRLPDGPPFYPMWRPPAGPRAGGGTRVGEGASAGGGPPAAPRRAGVPR